MALKARAGVGMMACKRALESAGGDIEKAIDLLRASGAAKAAKRASKSAGEGVVASYIHHGGRIGVLLELRCETDFVANTDVFRSLARDLAMHVAAMSPIAVGPEEVDPAIVERERSVYARQVAEEGKPEHIRERIVEGKLRKFFAQRTLLNQSYVKDPEIVVRDLVTEVSAKTGEKVEVGRFVRFQVGS